MSRDEHILFLYNVIFFLVLYHYSENLIKIYDCSEVARLLTHWQYNDNKKNSHSIDDEI